MLLIAIVLGTACACAAIGTAAAIATPALHPESSALRASAVRARGASHRPKHAHTSCRISRNRHHKHRQHCRARVRALRGHSLHHSNRNADRQTTKRSPAHKLDARRARHGGEASTTVTLGPTPPTTSAATIASVLDTPCQNTELMPEAGNLELVEAATLCLVNQERARNDELPLQANVQLTQVAQAHSEAMVSEDYFAHITPDGETQLERVQKSKYIPNEQVGYTIGENIAWGTLYLATPSAIVAAWIASPEHLANILNGEYRDTGIGIDPAVPPSLANAQAGAIYTQEFGVIDG